MCATWKWHRHCSRGRLDWGTGAGHADSGTVQGRGQITELQHPVQLGQAVTTTLSDLDQAEATDSTSSFLEANSGVKDTSDA
jgi:hypothetical protein